MVAVNHSNRLTGRGCHKVFCCETPESQFSWLLFKMWPHHESGFTEWDGSDSTWPVHNTHPYCCWPCFKIGLQLQKKLCHVWESSLLCICSVFHWRCWTWSAVQRSISSEGHFSSAYSVLLLSAQAPACPGAASMQKGLSKWLADHVIWFILCHISNIFYLI